MPAFFSRPKRYPITEKPITSPTDKRIYQDIFNLIATFLNLFRDLDARLEAYVTEAPDDGKTYGRKDKDWTEIVTGEGIPEAPEDGNLYGRKDAEWQIVPGGGGGDGVWGSITGDIETQLDLQIQFATKEPAFSAGYSNQYYRGDKNWADLDAGAVAGLGTAALADVAYFATAAQGALADSAVQPGDLATVAFSGDYTDLSNKPAAGVPEAPNNANTYGRKGGAWVIINSVDVYAALKTILVAGTSVGIVWDDVNKTATINAGVIPPRTEFAGTVTWAQSSVYSGVTAATSANMKDNDTTTGTGTDTAATSWIRGDLGAATTITAITVAGGIVSGWGAVSTYLNGALLQSASSTGGPWTTRATISGVTDSGTDIIKQFVLTTPVSARYWRLSATSNYVSTTEFRFYID